ncbi:NAD(P)/FAD-dependent oxidoreductase [Nocardia brasiliensis]
MTVPTTAAVLGGSIAGLLAAAVLADHVDRVVVIERDPLNLQPCPRPGVPQGAHVHALIARGQFEIERLVPGFMASLRAAGAPVADFTADVLVRAAAGWGVRFRSDLPAVGASRPLLESVIRHHVLRRSSIDLLSPRIAAGLIVESRQVVAVRVHAHGRSRRAASEIAVDFVVDATGRGSRADRWLQDHGFPPAPQRIIDAGIGYASRSYRIPVGHHADWTGCYIQPAPTMRARGAVLMPIEGDRWLVTLIGVGADRPTGRDEDFLPFAASLCSPIVAEALATAEPLSVVRVSRSTSNRRRFLERVPAQPDNFVRLGDAVCHFDPVYAQGMTTAALSAALLGRCLAEREISAGFAPFYHRKLASIIRWPWLMATTADQRWPLAQGPPPTWIQRRLAAYGDRVAAAGTVDPRIQLAFAQVFTMTRTPASLLAPVVVTKTVRNQRCRRDRLAAEVFRARRNV